VTAARQFQAAPRRRGPVKQLRGQSSSIECRQFRDQRKENINHETLESHERKVGHNWLRQSTWDGIHFVSLIFSALNPWLKVPKSSLATAERHWTYARAWLFAELKNRGHSERILRIFQKQ
jgi:hypothetical protein